MTGGRRRRRPPPRVRLLGGRDRHGAHHRLVRPDRRPVDRLLRPRGLRLRRRHAAAGAGQGRDRAPGHDQHHRPGLGRQRGVGAGRRRRDVRGLPGVVRHPLQRLLPAAAADPGRADRARRWPSSTATSATTTPWRARWDRAHHLRLARCRRCCGAWRSPTSSRGVPIDADQGVHRQPVHPAQPVRAARRAGDAAAVPHPRRDLHRAQDRRRHPAPGPRAGAAGSALVAAVARRGVPGLDLQVATGSAGSAVALRARRAALLGRARSRRTAGREGWAFAGTFVDDRARGGRAVRRALPRRDAVDAPTRPTP